MTVVKMPNKKIPGVLQPPLKSEIDGKIKDLSTLTLPELQDLLNRQNKILSNTAFFDKLPDKGSKITNFKQKIEEQIKVKHEKTCMREMFERLNLDIIDKETVQNIEWKGKVEKTSNIYLDSDDDSEPEDALSVLSQQTMHQRKVKILKDEPTSITSADLEEIYPPDQIPHVKYIMNKTEKSHQKAADKFKPYKTTKSDVHDPSKEATRKKHKNWEITAATPPPIQHGPAKVLSIEESVKLLTEQNKLMREIETKHAAERLEWRAGVHIGAAPASATTCTQYREDVSEDSDAAEGEGEGGDSDEEHERGGVVFTVTQ